MTLRRIVHLVSTLEVGGLERFVLRVADRQRRSGYDVSVLALKSGGPLRQEAEQAGLKVSVLGGKSRLLRVLRGMLIFARLQPDIIHGHNATCLQYARLGRRVGKPSIVITAHGRGKADNREPGLAEWAEVDRIVAVSEAVAEEMRSKAPAGRLIVIHNGVEAAVPAKTRTAMRAELNLADEVVGLIAARIDHLKGHETLLRAGAALQAEGRPITLLIVGDGAERAKQEALAAQLGLPKERVRFLGFRSDVNDLLSAADFFVLPSLTEGLPLSILEAMARSLPIVATRVGGIPELVTDEQEGLLVPSQDVKSLTEAIGRVAESEPLRRRLGCNALRRVQEDFSFDAMLRSYEDLYHSLMA